MLAHTGETKTFIFMDWVAYWGGKPGCSSPSTNMLRDRVELLTVGSRTRFGGCQMFEQTKVQIQFWLGFLIGML